MGGGEGEGGERGEADQRIEGRAGGREGEVPGEGEEKGAEEGEECPVGRRRKAAMARHRVGVSRWEEAGEACGRGGCLLRRRYCTD